MSAPANDNLSNATVLSGQTGSIFGTNISSSVEVSESLLGSNYGKTVWYEWTNFSNSFQNTFFSTRASSPITNSFRTVLQVFTGSSPAYYQSMSQVTYFNAANFTTSYAGWDIGSLVAFQAAANCNYYVRVDGLLDAVGNFTMSWGEYIPLNFGTCSECSPIIVSGTGIQCLGSSSPNVETAGGETTANFSNTSSYPEGIYTIKYCKGAFIVLDTNPLPWTVLYTYNDGEGGGSGYYVQYMSASASTSSIIYNLPPYTYPNSYGAGNAPVRVYPTQAAAELAFNNSCAYTTIFHSGGNISMSWYDTGGDDESGNPNPTWGLYKINPNFSIETACVAWNTPYNGTANCTFTVLNDTIGNWYNFSCSLLNTGGITGASKPITGSNISALSTNTYTFNFSASQEEAFATLLFSASYFTETTSSILLQSLPVVVFSNPSFEGTCGSIKYYSGFYNCSNYGNWTMNNVYYSASITGSYFVGGSPSCATSSLNSYVFTPNTFYCNSPDYSGDTILQIKASGSTSIDAILNITVGDDFESNYWTFSQSIVIPS